METFVLPDTTDCQGVLNKLSEAYSIARDAPRNTRQRFYDTFDWRLYAEGLILSKEPKAYRLQKRHTIEPVETVPWTSRRQPRFWYDFSDGPLKQKLQTYLDVRALLPLVDIGRRTWTIRVLDNNEKTVVRAYLEEIALINGQQKTPLVNTIAVQPVRGYRKEAREFYRCIRDLGIAQDSADVVRIVLNAIGKTPGDYSSKLKIQLHPALPAERAVRQILSHLIRTMRQNEAGIKSDIDTEFLHDFRVAVRRTRSALTQIKNVFPREVTDRFKQDFAGVGKFTNRMRDLDVYLLKQEQYSAMLPEPLRPGLDALFQHLQADRKREYRKLVRALDAPSYNETIASWEDFLNSPVEGSICRAKNAGKPAIDVARKFICKKHRRVLDAGRKIGDNTPDEELHTLRIECKKLRYLLEFFTSLFPPEEMKDLVRQFKKLQDNLGDFNDLSVQQKELEVYLKNAASPTGPPAHTAAAIGGLVAALYQKQQEVRRAFTKTFNAFSQPETTGLFQRLFG